MNINSYNVTDVAYHYIGLRVIAGLPVGVRREEQIKTISNSVRKYVSDRALRLMLPEPRGTYETAGEKICQELTQLQFAQVIKGRYELSDTGNDILSFLNNRQYTELRRTMVKAHLQTYDNLRLVLKKHLAEDAIWRPIVDSGRSGNANYITCLLSPTFGEKAAEETGRVLSELGDTSPKKIENALQQTVLKKMIPEMRIGVPMFRAMCDRLVSLRLLNQRRDYRENCEFLKTYSLCYLERNPDNWCVPLDIHLNSREDFPISLNEPDMADPEMLAKLLNTINEVLGGLSQTAGYYDLPDVRDNVVERIKIPEAAFDEGLNRILDMDPRPFTMGLQYDGITGRRKPLVRDSNSTQIYNLIRRA